MLSILLIVCTVLQAIVVFAYDCPLPLCDCCVPVSEREGPGIGFELTTSYGSVLSDAQDCLPSTYQVTSTASIKYHNGTIYPVAIVPATPPYISLLTRLSLSTTPPRPSFLERQMRWLNKRLGRPATADVGTISTLLTSLRHATEAHLKQPLDRVVVTTPQFPGLTRDDLRDAIEYAGLRSWLEYPLPYPKMLSTLNAAFAGNNLGLCTEWRNIYACWEEAEEGYLPLETVLGVAFTNSTLHASISRIDYAFQNSYDRPRAAPNLGLNAIHDYESPEGYWTDMRDWLHGFVREVEADRRPVTALVLMGENAGMEEFGEVLKDALGQERAQNLHVRIVADPMWAASRGAAMYARVRQEVPWNCQEPETCDEERTRLRHKGEL